MSDSKAKAAEVEKRDKYIAQTATLIYALSYASEYAYPADESIKAAREMYEALKEEGLPTP